MFESMLNMGGGWLELIVHARECPVHLGGTHLADTIVLVDGAHRRHTWHTQQKRQCMSMTCHLAGALVTARQRIGGACF